MSHVATLIAAYQRRGYRVRNGLNPAHFGGQRSVQFTALYRDDEIKATGGGLSPPECQVIERLGDRLNPHSVFVIGNAFGWSTLLLSLTFPNAQVVAIDNLTEGGEARLGLNLTETLFEDLGSRGKVIVGESPRDVAPIVNEHLGSIGLALIDGLHTNDQQWKDYQAVKPLLSDDAVVLFHDVLDFGLMPCFERIQSDWSGPSTLLH